MRLRSRLTLLTLALSLPLLVTIYYLQTYAQERALGEAVAEFVSLHMQTGERSRCEADPESWTDEMGGRRPDEPSDHDNASPHPDGHHGFILGGPGIHLYAYGADFRSLNARAPELSPLLIARLAHGEPAAHRLAKNEHGGTEETLVRMAWSEGPCAFVLAYRHAPQNRELQQALSAFVIVAVFLMAMLVALHPIVLRMRALADAVLAQDTSALAKLTRGSDEISEIARSFVAADSEIRSQVAQKEQRAQALRVFLENTTHDVMTPLSVLLGNVGEMQQRLADARAIDANLVGQVGSESHYIAAIIRNLSTAARLDAGQTDTQRRPTDLNRLVSRVMARHAPIAREREVKLDSGVPERETRVACDETLVEQALGNIVDNALRYNHAGGHVAVVLEQVSDRFILAVVDDGPGIAAEDMSRLHERYFRGNQARTRAPGRGLGLNITAQVAELHNWSLEFTRSEYGGLRVALSGPLCERSS